MLLSLAVGLVVGVLLMWLAVPALKYEVVEQANLLTRVLGYGFLLVPVALATVLTSPMPVLHTVSVVVGATTVLTLTAGEHLGTPMPYVWLAAATLFGCAAARIIRNERAVTP
ncbi:hypothetical protein SAMN05216188_101350 [Lentzea xinjiangensis]|uniref:Uncharacterized protein n=1 Tax=Lentzea xinjiangensis TaxID=402600 RepID=A0A1H9ACU3_9PSEU|nr:hypothetical protein SAMN05216188_101350 [Lentzea xinjiangensis]